jgi:hypothetical protein
MDEQEEYISDAKSGKCEYRIVTIRHLGVFKYFNKSKYTLRDVKNYRDRILKLHSVKHHNFLEGKVATYRW